MKKMSAQEGMHAVLDALPQMLEDVIAEAFKRGRQDHAENDCLVQKDRDRAHAQRNYYIEKFEKAKRDYVELVAAAKEMIEAYTPSYENKWMYVDGWGRDHRRSSSEDMRVLERLQNAIRNAEWLPPTAEQIEQAKAEGKQLGDYIAKEARRVSSEEERLPYKEDVACSSRAPGTISSAQQSSPLDGDDGERCEPNSPIDD